MGIHRATDIKEDQHFDGIASLWPQDNIEIAILCRGIDRAFEVELRRSSIAGPTTQAAQRDFNIAGAQLNLIVEIFILALVPDFDRATVAAFLLADPHAFGIIAIGPKR